MNDERLVHINSSYKTSGTNTNFLINYNNALHLQNAKYVRLRCITVPNMFYNIYGNTRFLYVEQSGIIYTIEIPSGNYTATSLCTALNNATATPPGIDPITVTYADGKFTYTAGTATIVLGYINSTTYSGNARTMNLIMGQNAVNDTADLVTTSTYPPALFGPTKLYIASDRLAFGYSVHANGLLHSKMGSISLAGVPYGSVAFMIVPERANTQVYFRDNRQVNNIDIEILDEYDANVELPPNANIDIELIIGFADF